MCRNQPTPLIENFVKAEATVEIQTDGLMGVIRFTLPEPVPRGVRLEKLLTAKL